MLIVLVFVFISKKLTHKNDKLKSKNYLLRLLSNVYFGPN